MKSYEVLEKRPFTGYGRTFAWGLVKNEQVLAYVYMGAFERVTPDSPAVDELRKRPKFAKLSKKEVADRINFELFMRHRHKTKGMLYDIAKKKGCELYSGRVHRGRFIVKEKEIEIHAGDDAYIGE